MNSIWTKEALVWGVQVVIVALGIHLFLRFVRATRGNRLIRGVLVTVLGGYLGLRILATAIKAEELSHLLEASTGFLIVTLAIVFQSELRRAIAQLGERSFVGRLIQPAGRDTLAQIAKAAQSMASQRIGALIAFERDTSLQSYIEEGTPIDADVNARLLESLFHPGTALHDGAVIVKGERIAAAGCFFPLPQEADLDANLGTRHRAAVGITEDTDAVVLVVSEETGYISIAREGQIASKIDPAQIEDSLKRILQQKDGPRGIRRHSLLPRSRAGWKRDITWLLASIVIAVSVLYLARRDLIVEEAYSVSLVAVKPNEPRQPGPNEVLLVLPSDNVDLSGPDRGALYSFTAKGTRGALGTFGGAPSGVYELAYLPVEGDAPPESERELARFIDLEKVKWETRAVNLSMEWEEAPEIYTEKFVTREFEVSATALTLALDTLESGFEVVGEGIQFEPANLETVAIRGPQTEVVALELGDASVFEPLDLAGTSREQREAKLRLSSRLTKLGLTLLETDVTVVIPLQASERQLDTVECPVVLVCFDPARAAELDKWRIPAHAQEVQIRVYSTGLIARDAETDSPVWSEKIAEVIRYVQEQLYAYVDIAELDSSDGARGVTVRYRLRETDWRESLAPILLDDGQSWREAWQLDALTLRLSGDQEILLEAVSDEELGPSDG